MGNFILPITTDVAMGSRDQPHKRAQGTTGVDGLTRPTATREGHHARRSSSCTLAGCAPAPNPYSERRTRARSVPIPGLERRRETVGA